jgi:DNA-binding transcriptional ArsR family regulator
MVKKAKIILKAQPAGPVKLEQLRDLAPSLASLAKGIADENRLRILLTVANGPKSVSRVVEEMELSQPLVSHHLKELRRSGLVKVERKGPFVYYEIAGSQVLSALASLADFFLKQTRKTD